MPANLMEQVIQPEFLTPLNRAIQLSRTFHSKELAIIEKDEKIAKDPMSENNRDVVKNALTSVDLLQSLVIIINDLVNQ